MLKRFPHIYANGLLYNLITMADDSFTYLDVYGICRLLEQYAAPKGVLEICSGWDLRGRAAIQHVHPEVSYFRDCDADINLYETGALARNIARLTGGGTQVSAVTGFSYPLNAVLDDKGDVYSYDDMVRLLTDVHAVLSPDGVAVFGIHNPLTSLPDEVNFTFDYNLPVAYARALSTTISTVSLTANVVASEMMTPYDPAYIRRIRYQLEVGYEQYVFDKDLQTVTWTGPQIHNAAVDAGFRHIAFFSGTSGDDGAGYSRFTLAESSYHSDNLSHVLFMK